MFWQTALRPLNRRLNKRFKRLKCWLVCRHRVLDVDALGVHFGTLTFKYAGMTPDGFTVADVHAEMDGKCLAAAFRQFDSAFELVKAYETVVQQIKDLGIDVLQAAIPEPVHPNLEKLLIQGDFCYVADMSRLDKYRKIQIWRRKIS